MLRLKEGDAVRVVERMPTPADAKSGLYYGYYRGLSGTVFKIYGNGEGAQAAIDVDIESLPSDIAQRHLETRDQMLTHLTGEARRSSLPGAEHEFRLRYVILVGVADLLRKMAASPRRLSNGNGKAH